MLRAGYKWLTTTNCPPRSRVSLVHDLNLPGDGPHKGRHFPRNSNYDLVSVLAPGEQAPVAFAEAHLRFPTDILDYFGQFLQAQL